MKTGRDSGENGDSREKWRKKKHGDSRKNLNCWKNAGNRENGSRR